MSRRTLPYARERCFDQPRTKFSTDAVALVGFPTSDERAASEQVGCEGNTMEPTICMDSAAWLTNIGVLAQQSLILVLYDRIRAYLSSQSLTWAKGPPKRLTTTQHKLVSSCTLAIHLVSHLDPF
jgi:hypothetical protein